MFKNFINSNYCLEMAKEEKKRKIVPEILKMILVILLGLIVSAVSSMFPAVCGFFYNQYQFTEVEFLCASLYTTIGTSAFFLYFCHKFQKRDLESLGFKLDGFLKEYGIGLLIGLIAMTVVAIVGWIFNAFDTVTVNKIEFKWIIAFFFGFVLQGMSEEIVCRGYIMTTFIRRHSVLSGIIINSLVFMLMHGTNTGYGIIPAINMILFSVFASLYMIQTENIWGVSAIHAIWNFAQGCIFGFSVSGASALPSIFSFSYETNNVLNGGEFGPEGGLIVMAVNLVLIAMCVIKQNRKETNQNIEELHNG